MCTWCNIPEWDFHQWFKIKPSSRLGDSFNPIMIRNLPKHPPTWGWKTVGAIEPGNCPSPPHPLHLSVHPGGRGSYFACLLLSFDGKFYRLKLCVVFDAVMHSPVELPECWQRYLRCVALRCVDEVILFVEAWSFLRHWIWCCYVSRMSQILLLFVCVKLIWLCELSDQLCS